MCAVSEMLLEKLQSKKYERGPMLSMLKELNVFLKKLDLVFQYDLRSLDIIQLNKIDTIEGLLGSLLVFKGLVKKRPWPCEMKSTFTCNLFSSA